MNLLLITPHDYQTEPIDSTYAVAWVDKGAMATSGEGVFTCLRIRTLRVAGIPHPCQRPARAGAKRVPTCAAAPLRRAGRMTRHRCSE